MHTPLPQPAQIVFSHGNSFPAGTYRVLLDLLEQQGHEVHAVSRFGHDPRYPVNNNWLHMVQELTDFCATLPDPAGQTRYLVGHSMGGILSLMAAARSPDLAQGVLLLDSPLLSGLRAGLVRLGKRTPLVHRFSPGATSHRRRQEWPSLDAAHQHFASKPVFASWHPQALADYIRHGTEDAPSEEQPQRRTLVFDRDVETAIYGTLPDNISAWLRRHPLRVPVAFIGGSASREMRQVGLSATRRVARERVYILRGGTHLFPMEQPEQTAALVARALGDLALQPAT